MVGTRSGSEAFFRIDASKCLQGKIAEQWYNREKACDAGKKKCRPQSHVSHRNGGTALWYFDREVVNKAKSGQVLRFLVTFGGTAVIKNYDVR
jgi:hypothetical protein